MSLAHLDPGTTGGLLLAALRRHPDRIAFADAGERLTYRAAWDRLGRFQAVLLAAGAGRGQGAAVLTSNRAASYLASAAATLAGLRTTALHPLGALEDHASVLEDAEISLLIVDVPAHLTRGGELAARFPDLTVITVGPADYGADILAGAEAVGARAPRDLASADDTAILSYTGGTTGRPKGALRRHREMVAMTAAVLAGFEFPEEIRFLAVSPISHVVGTKVLPTLIRGGTFHMLPAFDPEAVLARIQADRITATLLVPTMIYVLLDHPALAETDLSALELLLYGASPMSTSRLAEGLERLGPVFSQLYGQTEAYPLTVLPRRAHDPARPDRLASCGLAVPGVTIALLDDDDQPIETGALGEICVRAPHCMTRYWKRPDETAAALSGGWLHTGDVAKADDEGYLTIMDRKKDMIVSGGFNVYPREVEDVLACDPAVAIVAVVGAPDEKWGEAVTAIVVARPGRHIDEAALRARVRDEKGPVMTPKRIDVVDALPLTPLGKPDKKALRARYWAGRERRVG